VSAAKPLKRRSILHINTHQAGNARLEFIPGDRPYIHFSCTGMSGFIDDKDIKKLQRFADSAAKSLKVRKK
jgi:hypothetical protein